MHHDYKTQMTCSQLISYDLDGVSAANIAVKYCCIHFFSLDIFDLSFHYYTLYTITVSHAIKKSLPHSEKNAGGVDVN